MSMLPASDWEELVGTRKEVEDLDMTTPPRSHTRRNHSPRVSEESADAIRGTFLIWALPLGPLTLGASTASWLALQSEETSDLRV
jgi:hypothetical protein